MTRKHAIIIMQHIDENYEALRETITKWLKPGDEIYYYKNGRLLKGVIERLHLSFGTNDPCVVVRNPGTGKSYPVRIYDVIRALEEKGVDKINDETL